MDHLVYCIFGFLTAVLIVLFFIWSVCLSVSTHYCVNKDYHILYCINSVYVEAW